MSYRTIRYEIRDYSYHRSGRPDRGAEGELPAPTGVAAPAHSAAPSAAPSLGEPSRPDHGRPGAAARRVDSDDAEPHESSRRVALESAHAERRGSPSCADRSHRPGAQHASTSPPRGGGPAAGCPRARRGDAAPPSPHRRRARWGGTAALPRRSGERRVSAEASRLAEVRTERLSVTRGPSRGEEGVRCSRSRPPKAFDSGREDSGSVVGGGSSRPPSSCRP